MTRGAGGRGAGARSVILVDTSAWVEFDRASRRRADRRLRELIADEGPIAVTEPLVMEVVAGARDEARERELRRLLARFHLLGFDAIADFDAATRISLTCRRRGVTPRGMVDRMIAAVALRTGASLLARDADLVRVAGVIGLVIDPASR